MKYPFRCILIVCLSVLASSSLFSQQEAKVVDKKKHKVVFQLTSGDTLVHKAMVRQIGHLLEAAPNSKIEVVCHSAGLPFLVTNQTKQAEKIKELKNRGVEFYACENSMRDKNVKKSDLLPESGTVPSGIVEVVLKQEKGWSYIKAGF